MLQHIHHVLMRETKIEEVLGCSYFRLHLVVVEHLNVLVYSLDIDLREVNSLFDHLG